MFNKISKIKLALFILCCSIGMSSMAQNATEPINGLKIKEINFKSSGTVLSGTIYRPKNIAGAVVIVHGSGQEKRMLALATTLAQSGIAVLTYDKRGVGQSQGTYVGPEVGTNNIDSANLDLLAMDAAAAAMELARYLPSRIQLGLLGFSQAGWVIPMAAAKNTKVDFMVFFSGPVATTLEQLRFQFYTNGNSKFWDTHTEADARAHISNDPDRYQFAATDAGRQLSQLSIPGLWLFGGRDIQAPVGLSIENLNMLRDKQKPYEFQLFPAMGHNTAFAKSQEPVIEAIKWIRALKQKGIGR